MMLLITNRLQHNICNLAGSVGNLWHSDWALQIYYHATRSSSWSTNFIYDQWPGILLMVFRLAVSVLFLAMIRPTFLLERAADKRVFYRWFSTAVSVWMAAIPVVVFLCEAVVSYWQVRVTEALLLVMNGIVFGILSLLMRPTRMAAMFPATQTFQESFLTGVPDLGSYGVCPLPAAIALWTADCCLFGPE